MAHLLGYDSPEEMRTYLTDIRQQLYVHPEDRDLIIADILKHGAVLGQELQCLPQEQTNNLSLHQCSRCV